MKERLRNFVLGILIFCFIFGISTLAATTQKEIDVTYRDIKLQIDEKEVTPRDSSGNIVEPFIYNGTTYLPVRAVAETLNRDVSWDNETSTVHINEKEAKKFFLYDLEPSSVSVKADFYKKEIDSAKYVGFRLKEALAVFRIPFTSVVSSYKYENRMTFAVPKNATYFSGKAVCYNGDVESPITGPKIAIFGPDGKILFNNILGEFKIDVSDLSSITIQCSGYFNGESTYPCVIKDGVFYVED